MCQQLRQTRTKSQCACKLLSRTSPSHPTTRSKDVRQQLSNWTSLLRPLFREDLASSQRVSTQGVSAREPVGNLVLSDSHDQIVNVDPNIAKCLHPVRTLESNANQDFPDLLAILQASRHILDSHIAAQTLPILELVLAAEISGKLGHDGVSGQWDRSGAFK